MQYTSAQVGKMLKKLKIFTGSEHNMQAQKPETLTLGGKR